MLAPRHKCHWTPAEYRRMEFMIGAHSVPVIAEMLGRTPDAIVRRVVGADNGLRQRAISAYGMSIPGVARVLGVDPSCVDRWVRSGKLPAHKSKLVRGTVRCVDSEDLTTFLESGYALMVNLKPVGDWVDVVSEARAQLAARYISGIVVADLIGMNRNFIAYQASVFRPFPESSIRLGTWSGGNYYERTAVRAWLDKYPQYWTKRAKDSL